MNPTDLLRDLYKLVGSTQELIEAEASHLTIHWNCGERLSLDKDDESDCLGELIQSLSQVSDKLTSVLSNPGWFEVLDQ